MRPLSPHLPFDPRETPSSYAARLARLHIGDQPGPFLRDLGIRPFDLRVDENGAIDRLAAVAGVDPETLRRNAARRTGRRTFMLRGHVISPDMLASPEIAFCPACLKDDDAKATGSLPARIGRLAWTLSVVRTCPEHGMALVRERAPGREDAARALDAIALAPGAAIDRLIETATRQEPTPLQQYVLDRLDGRQGPAWLDSQTLDQAVWTTERLGIALLRGPKTDVKNAIEADLERARTMGFSFTRHGEEGIREALSRLRSRHYSSGAKAGPHRVFGRFFDALAFSQRSREHGDILRIVRDVIAETFEMPAGAVVLGVALPERRRHSVASLAAETGVDRDVLLARLVAGGVIPKDRRSDTQFAFDAEAGRGIAMSIDLQVSTAALPNRLNCDAALVEDLLDERVLVPITDRGDVQTKRAIPRVAARDVEALMSAIEAVASPVAHPPHRFKPIVEAALEAKVRAIDILHLVLGRHLSHVYRIDGVPGVAGLLVNPFDVRRLAAAHLSDLAPTQAFKVLWLSVESGWSLIENASGRPALGRRLIMAAHGDHAFTRVPRAEVEAFRERYVTTRQIAVEKGLSRDEVHALIRDHKVRYAARRWHVGVDLIERGKLPEALAF